MGSDFKQLLASIDKDQLAKIIDRQTAQSCGLTLDEYEALMAYNKSLQEEGALYLGKPVCEWPALVFNWDYSQAGQHFAMDGVTEQAMLEMYPNGLRLGHMPLRAFDQNLARYCRRDTEKELWSLGSDWRLAQVIAHLRRGMPMTPPLVIRVKDEAFFSGGNHRYAAAKAVGLAVIPFYVNEDDVAEIEEILDVTWGQPR
ncbi:MULTISPECIES: transcriptional regulator [Comamonas]|uniref:transcriptional regulator n=1 Tax=Comamonas TaxID=283 RepID=UPI0015FE42DC|nr:MULTISPECIES: transcriptional regulator [Comamonas]UUC96556.1 hypothetical protein NOX35_26980 [Comamonas sp. C11]